MNILYHLSTLPPRMERAEAIAQEVTALRGRFDGDVMYVNPNQNFSLYIPRLFFGLHKLSEIRKRESGLSLHHFYNPDPFPFPYLRLLQRPIIYSITCGVGGKKPDLAFFSSLAAVAVFSARAFRKLESWGLKNVVRVHPGIDTSRFTHSPLPLGSEIRLMVGSAPWTKGQFRTKGVDALLSAARQNQRLRLVFLWRGVLAEEIERRVRRMNLGAQVTVLNELVNVNEVLAGAHASITLAAAPGIVKSYPHSLIESLAAGKPVLVSRAVPMADYVEETDCGRVVENVTPASILTAIEDLVSRYDRLQGAARRVGQRDFAQEGLIASFEKVYERVR